MPLLVIESGPLRPVAAGGMIGGVAHLGYQLPTAVTGDNLLSSRRDEDSLWPTEPTKTTSAELSVFLKRPLQSLPGCCGAASREHHSARLIGDFGSTKSAALHASTAVAPTASD
ncbi:MAG: hypothetical protein R3C49_15590 [Planctomycetaceae bacterium]